jgi:putative (di)nucleoside polyphosphate hydrolase
MQKEVYRQCASIVLFRKTPQSIATKKKGPYQVFLLKKPRTRDAWQLPQGGVENTESVKEAALRELQEESGLSSVEFLQQSPHIYQYDFPQSYRRFRPDNVKGQQISFIFAFLASHREVTVDQNEIESFAWVFPSDLHLSIRRKSYLSFVRERVKEGLEILSTNT